MSAPLLIAIDDEPEIASLVVDVAAPLGFRALSATSVREFYRLTEAQWPDVIVSDLCIPEVDGIELMQQLVERGSEAGLILISGYGGRYLPLAEMIGRERGLHLLGQLEKPFSLDALRQVLRQALAWCAERQGGTPKAD
jgi:DNA-binding NtrC family response regulator